MTPNSTTKLGITVFDQAFGGIYLHRPTILCGRRKSGKFVVATQLLVKTLRAGENVVLFTAKNPEEVIRAVPEEIIDLGEAVENGQFLICPYSGMQRSGAGPYAPLPFPQALDELSTLVKDNGVTYAIFDSVVPWTAIQPLEAMQEHVDTFFSTLDVLALTSLLLLPEPASAAALSLATILREVCPINIEISAKNFGAEFTMQVTKYQGMPGGVKKLPQKFSLDLTPGVGFDSPDAPKAKTLSDLEAFASSSRAAAALKQKSAPAFRPFLAASLADFVDSETATTSAPPTSTPAAKSAVLPTASAAKSTMPPSFASATSAPPSFASAKSTMPPSFASATNASPSFASATSASPSFASATSAPPPIAPASTSTSPTNARKSDSQKPKAASGAQDGFSFASVIDLPEFPHAAKPAAQPEHQPVTPPPASSSGIQFSSVIN